MNSNLKIATWNILHGTFKEDILEGLYFLIAKAGADVICLQEAETRHTGSILAFLKEKGLGQWQLEAMEAKPTGAELIILYNGSRLTLQGNPQLWHMPVLPNKPFLQRMFGRKGIPYVQRAAMATNFLLDGKPIRIVTAHLAYEGGLRHRRKQLSTLGAMLRKTPVEREVLCGDFNTTSFLPGQNWQEQRIVQESLGPDFVNANTDLSWSFSLATIDHTEPVAFLRHIPLWIRKRLRSRMDYVLGRGLRLADGEAFDLRGSDHRAVAGTFEI